MVSLVSQSASPLMRSRLKTVNCLQGVGNMCCKIAGSSSQGLINRSVLANSNHLLRCEFVLLPSVRRYFQIHSMQNDSVQELIYSCCHQSCKWQYLSIFCVTMHWCLLFYVMYYCWLQTKFNLGDNKGNLTWLDISLWRLLQIFIFMAPKMSTYLWILWREIDIFCLK